MGTDKSESFGVYGLLKFSHLLLLFIPSYTFIWQLWNSIIFFISQKGNATKRME